MLLFFMLQRDYIHIIVSINKCVCFFHFEKCPVRDIDRTRSCKKRVQFVMVKDDKELVGFVRFAKGTVVSNIILMPKIRIRFSFC